MTKEELLIDLIDAYRDARRRIRGRGYQLAFEQNLESELLSLRDELWAMEWTPLPAEAFIVFRPVQREVFASQFRDRVVHHLLFNYLSPVMERVFIRDSYSCRKGKGTSDAVDRLNHHIRSATDCYRNQAYLLKMDIQGYFMSIDHGRLISIINRHLDRYWTRTQDRKFVDYLVQAVVLNNVSDNCIIRGHRSDWVGLPQSKSLFNREQGYGLPIGDLTSQLFSNIYLNELDQYVKRVLKCRHYGRYVDDFFIIDTDLDRLNDNRDKLVHFLSDHLGLRINTKKTMLQPAEWPVTFIGQRIQPYHMVPSERIIHQFKRAVNRVRNDCGKIVSAMPYGGIMDEDTYRVLYYADEEEYWHRAVNVHSCRINRNLSVLNSYLGYFRHCKSYHLVSEELSLSGASGDIEEQDDPMRICYQFNGTRTKARISCWYKHKFMIA